MSRTPSPKEPAARAFFTPPPGSDGLTGPEARRRHAAGAHNAQPQSLTPSVGRILRKNTLTLFNFIMFFLAAVLVIRGEPKNALFIGIAVCNTVMGIFQELRAKRTLDRLSILTKGRVTVIRDGKPVSIDRDDVVLHDLMLLSAGDQICTDAQIVETDGLEASESLLTGEPDNIRKKPGDAVMSGSFVTAGRACARVVAVGADNYATALTAEAKKTKNAKSRLMRILNNIIRAVTALILPIGILLFYTQYATGMEQPGADHDAVLSQATVGAAASMTGMIPQGLILLTGITLTVGALNLARRKTLVQSLYSIETLARTDVLCLDKTGTITDGTLSFEEIIPMAGFSGEACAGAVSLLMGALRDENATAACLREKFGKTRALEILETIPFSSARKWSGACFSGKGTYILGAPGFVFPGGREPFMKEAEKWAAQGCRVLCLAHSESRPQEERLPAGLRCMALLLLSDTVRPDAPDTFRYFAEEGIILKVISGDDPLTVSHIAAKAGIAGAERAVDMSLISDEDFTFLVEENTVFGRVSPLQKRALIKALQANGHTTCMTGDGVNDILAMKASDSSVAMIGGSDAARGACDFVLLSSSFSSMIHVLKEGRRVINNIELVSSLYLVQTVFTALLSLIYIFLPYAFPYQAVQMTPINALTVGIPTFFLALRKSYRRPEGKFTEGILEHSFPAALTVVFNLLIIQLAGALFDIPFQETSTMGVFLVGIVGFSLLGKVARPFNPRMKVMMFSLLAVFALLFGFSGSFFSFFEYEGLFTRNVFFYLPLMYTSTRMLGFWGNTARAAARFVRLHRKRGV